jgi:CheY-like chemotaxis protein
MNNRAYKVLVADDDESVRESLCKLLHGEGYQVAAVANGAEAVESICRMRNRIDLLLVDLNMPLKNGWATLDRLLDVNPSLPVLIVTGQPNQYEMAEAAGVSALVEKPIDVPALLQLIHKLLTGPVESRLPLPGSGHRGFPFHLVRAAGYTSRYPWKERNITPYTHWGLNE